jgi:uncharacterized membrane protein
MDNATLAGVREHLVSLCSKIEVVLCGCKGETSRFDVVEEAVSELKVALATPSDQMVYVALKHLLALMELFIRWVHTSFSVSSITFTFVAR